MATTNHWFTAGVTWPVTFLLSHLSVDLHWKCCFSFILFYLVHNCLGMYGLLVQVIRYLISIWVHDCLRNKHKAKSNYKAVCSVDCTKKTKKELIKNESIKWPYFEAYKLHSLPTLQTFTPSPKSPCILYSEGHIWSQYWDQ